VHRHPGLVQTEQDGLGFDALDPEADQMGEPLGRRIRRRAEHPDPVAFPGPVDHPSGL
jgi:hypothetical protein